MASFSVVIGGYLGLLAAGATGLVLGTEYVTRWPVVIGGAVGVLAVARSYTRPATATRLVRTRLYLLPIAVPILLTCLVPGFALFGHHGYERWLADRLGELFVVTGAGGLVYLVTANRHVASLHEREPIVAEWSARPDARYLRLLRASGLALGCSCLVVGFDLIHIIETDVNPLPAFGGAAIGQAITVGRRRTYTLFESGLCVRRAKAFNHQFVPRSQLRAVDFTEDRLEIKCGLPWPFPVRCATETMRRPKRVADAVAGLLESTRERK
ncbi:hypothetical protein [Natrinema sp. 74]|uniref:hypothetical protein n=1 Tax=Natrinema sp. 74 TaxID=3384159 RepID=UPI0038D4BC25